MTQQTATQWTVGVLVSIAIATMGVVLSGISAYTSTDKMNERRITAVEVKQKEDDNRRRDDRDLMIRIEAKLDRVIERVAPAPLK